MKNHSFIMIFLDGVGIGEEDSEKNPFYKYNFKLFSEIFSNAPSHSNLKSEQNGVFFFPTDANLGVDGLPQSGTGQTSIFCGVNAQKIIGKHFGPFPYSTLIPIIEKKNIFKAFANKGLTANFVNAYPKVFFDYIKSGRKRLGTISLSRLLNGEKLNSSTDLRKGNALTAEIDNNRWVSKLNYNLPVIKPETAARRFLKISEKNNFTLFEYFFTDHIGHGRNVGPVEQVLLTLDSFLTYVVKNLNENQTLLICSDHGNLEDFSIKSHTRNPAFTLSAGKYAERLASSIERIDQIKPKIMELFE